MSFVLFLVVFHYQRRAIADYKAYIKGIYEDDFERIKGQKDNTRFFIALLFFNDVGGFLNLPKKYAEDQELAYKRKKVVTLTFAGAAALSLPIIMFIMDRIL